MREKHYNTTLKDSTSDTHKKIKNLNKDLETIEKCLRENEYVVKDSFEAAAKINSVLLGDISDVESLFTNVPLKKTSEQSIQWK